MKEDGQVFLEPDLADFMSEYDLRLRIYQATIRKLLHSQDIMYEKLIQSRMN